MSFSSHDDPLGQRSRVLLVLWSLFLVAGFLLAVQLEPDQRGYGTHQSLGLPPCIFRESFNVPCPSCGMTTSFSNFVRGRFIAAARANSAGLLLAVICVIQIPWCLACACHNRMCYVKRPTVALIWLLGSVFLVSILQWTLRIVMPPAT
jgi:hypothetical protein